MRLSLVADAAGNLAIVVALAAIVLLVWLVGRVARLASDIVEIRRVVEDLLGARRGSVAESADRSASAAAGDDGTPGPEEPPAPSSSPETLSSEPRLAGGHRVVREADAAPTDPWTCKDCGFSSNSRAAARAHRIATGARSLVPHATATDADQGSDPR